MYDVQIQNLLFFKLKKMETIKTLKINQIIQKHVHLSAGIVSWQKIISLLKEQSKEKKEVHKIVSMISTTNVAWPGEFLNFFDEMVVQEFIHLDPNIDRSKFRLMDIYYHISRDDNRYKKERDHELSLYDYSFWKLSDGKCVSQSDEYVLGKFAIGFLNFLDQLIINMSTNFKKDERERCIAEIKRIEKLLSALS